MIIFKEFLLLLKIKFKKKRKLSFTQNNLVGKMSCLKLKLKLVKKEEEISFR
jgi:hypothetical protein